MKEKIENVNTIVTLENSKEINGLHFTIKHSGKMQGMTSLSTSTLCNPNCARNSKIKGSICEKCYARKHMKYRTTLIDPLSENTKILTSSIIPFENLPIINRLYFRFEAFGDIINETQVINYFNICKKNPGVNFALWTKNPGVIDNAIYHGNKKPYNLNIIYSSLFINQLENINKYDFIDKIFTVYDSETIEKENIKINCGSKSCLDCLKCYTKNNETNINERLK